jgi:hypothetical protein
MKLNLNDVGSLIDATTAQTTINNNNTSIENAVENTLSRDGTSPNQMESNFDMNGNSIVNLPKPLSATEPLRLQDLDDFNANGTFTPLPAGGTTGQTLTKTSGSDYAVGWSNAGQGTVSSVALSAPADFTVSGSPVTTAGTLGLSYATTPTGTGALVRKDSPDITGTAPNLTSGHVTTNANLTGPITSVGNATSVAAQTGTGSTFVMQDSPALTTPSLGTPASGNLLSCTGYPVTSLANVASYSLIGNNTSGSAAPSAIQIPSLTTKATPAAGDYVLLVDTAASNAFKKATVSSMSTSAGVTSIDALTGAFTTGSGLLSSGNILKPDPAVFYGFLGGLTVSTTSGSATFGVSVGACANSTGAEMMKLTSAYTKNTGSWTVGSGNGALDTGTIAANSWYYVYVIKRLDTGVVDILISLSATSPTLPTNYTVFRRIGAMRSVAGVVWREVTQFGDNFYYTTPFQDINLSGTLTTSRSLQTLTAPPSMIAMTRIYFFNAGAASTALVQPPLETDRAVGAFMSLTAEVANQGQSGHFQVPLNSSSQIALRAGSASGSITVETLGWTDFRGK